MYEPASRYTPNLLFLWPAFAAASLSEFNAFAARQFADLAAGRDHLEIREPAWATPHTIALELQTVRVRRFGAGNQRHPTLLCAPFSLHGSSLTDLAPDHSLVEALLRAGIQQLFVTDWRSATKEMCFLGIDNYLADLNVVVDELAKPVDLIGLCQGGWLALAYAARFPAKVRKLVLGGAPIDIAAGTSTLSMLADASPLPVFEDLVQLGQGVVPGRKVMKFWGTDLLATEDAWKVLQMSDGFDSLAFKRVEALFRDWYAWTVDLPGKFFLEVVERLYKRNELATAQFVALGKRIDLATVNLPLFLLAAADDELVALPQLFATQTLVSTPRQDVRKATVPGRHIGLFVGSTVLKNVWPTIVHWLAEQSTVSDSNYRLD
jgi:poly(3-hydroxybutyrate) depolymerase